MIESISFLLSGIVFGLAAGISPGPLLALVISETLRHGKKEGILTAIAPLVTDLPIVIISVLILAKLSHSHFLLGVISITGAVFIGYLAYESITVKSSSLNIKTINPQSLRKGIITNFLSPHPYLFWIAVGAPMVLKAYQSNIWSAIFFVGGFYFLLVGSKIITALLIDKSRDIMRRRGYLYTIKALGFMLLIIAFLFIRDGLKLMGFFQPAFF
jgi:threonine/homoserine/homoserine lactone efflux protein